MTLSVRRETRHAEETRTWAPFQRAMWGGFTRGFPKVAALVEIDEQKNWGIESPYSRHVYLVEPSWGGHEPEWYEDGEGKYVEGRLVGENGIALDVLERQHGAPELYLRCGVFDQFGERMSEH